MPRERAAKRTRASRRRAAPSNEAKAKLAAIASKAEEEGGLDSLLQDFDIQTAPMKKQARKCLEAEAKRLLAALPVKSNIPRDILRMEVDEFIRRGGTFQLAVDSLSADRMKGNTVELASCTVGSSSATCSTTAVDSAMGAEFVTPAVGTRSHNVTGGGVSTANASKRRPNPLERVTVGAWSEQSGSPVDEQTFMQLKAAEYIATFEEQLLQDVVTVNMPQRWQSQVMKSLRKIKAQAQAVTTNADYFVTPMVHR